MELTPTLYYADMKYPRATRLTLDLGMVLTIVGSCLMAAVALRMFNGPWNDHLFYPSVTAATAGFLSLVVSSLIAKIRKPEPEAAPRPTLMRVK